MKLSRSANKKGILIDTNILIYILGGNSEIMLLLEKAASLHISAVVVAEVLAGTPENKLEEVKEFLNEFEVLPVTQDVAELAGIYRALNKRFKVKDMLIAATAQVYNLTLFTANKKDFHGILKNSPIWLEQYGK